MLDIKCDKCNFRMMESNVVTAQEYSKDTKFIYNEAGEFNVDALPNYIAFVCHKCGNIKKLSFLEILEAEKKIIAELVAILRSEQCSKTSRSIHINEDNNIIYCGVCPGFCDGDGFCFVDAVTNCKFRRETLGA